MVTKDVIEKYIFVHFDKRNCSKDGTKEYIASENICVCKTGWETAIDQNPATRVYCNLYVGTSNNRTSSSTPTMTESSIIIIIIILVIIGICVCCCCRKPMMHCMQDLCCGCSESFSPLEWGFKRSATNTQNRSSTCNCHANQNDREMPSCHPHSHNCHNDYPSCQMCHSPRPPAYIQHPPTVWIPNMDSSPVAWQPKQYYPSMPTEILSNDERDIKHQRPYKYSTNRNFSEIDVGENGLEHTSVPAYPPRVLVVPVDQLKKHLNSDIFHASKKSDDSFPTSRTAFCQASVEHYQKGKKEHVRHQSRKHNKS
eukprot:jgi/Galph1/4419/GphlegSOOS_G3108.1